MAIILDFEHPLPAVRPARGERGGSCSAMVSGFYPFPAPIFDNNDTIYEDQQTKICRPYAGSAQPARAAV